MIRLNNLLIAFTALFLISLPLAILAQEMPSEKKLMHREQPDEMTIQLPPSAQKTSPAYQHSSKGFFMTQVNVDADGMNILNDAANEPSIAIDPTNPDRMMIGWRQFDNISSNFRQAGYAYTLDGGHSWTFPGSIDAGVFRSDPVLGVDHEGTFYYNSLTVLPGDEYACDVYKTLPGTQEWDEGTFAYGGDKQWMVIDHTSGESADHNYSFWTQYYSYCYPHFFTRSTDLGGSYEPCVSINGSPYWGTLAIGPEGELYIAGAGDWDNIMLVKSLDARYPGEEVTWSQYTAVDLGGYINGWTPVNPQGLLGQVYVDVDLSDGPGHGNVYVVASVVRPQLDAADVMFARSTDGGSTFDAPVRVNDDLDNSNYQWFGTMSVAPNGRIDVVWLDTRNDVTNGTQSALYYAYSTDQGENWSVNQKLSDIFNPHVGYPQQDKMGDYYHMISDDGGANLAWACTLNGEQDVYYAYIEPESVGVEEPISNVVSLSVSNYPNPFSANTSLRYSLSAASQVRFIVYDIFGKEMMEPLNALAQPGVHTLRIETSSLPDGVYIGKLFAGGNEAAIRMVKAGGQ